MNESFCNNAMKMVCLVKIRLSYRKYELNRKSIARKQSSSFVCREPFTFPAKCLPQDVFDNLCYNKSKLNLLTHWESRICFYTNGTLYLYLSCFLIHFRLSKRMDQPFTLGAINIKRVSILNTEHLTPQLSLTHVEIYHVYLKQQSKHRGILQYLCCYSENAI